MHCVKVKICGITNIEDARLALEAGADYLGFNFYEKSPRYISPIDAQVIARQLPPSAAIVGIFVNAVESGIKEIARRVPLDVLQLHGDEPPELLNNLVDWTTIKAIRVKTAEELASQSHWQSAADYVLIDSFSENSFGGTGKMIPPEIAAALSSVLDPQRIFLAGGLTPENVAHYSRTFIPFAVDVASGVEENPRKKDAEKVRAFIQAAKNTAL